jgi:broad specificity phosphatase PhoE
MSKTIYCIRHGLSLHNKLYHKYGSKTFYDNDYTDTMLLPEGKQQAQELARTWKEINTIDLVIVSPLKRTLETAMNIFDEIDVPMIALEMSREFPLGLHTCNKRSNKEELELLYPRVNFDNLVSNKDNIWDDKKEETIEMLNSRIDLIKKYMKDRPEENIAFVNHSSFIGQMKDNDIKYLDNGDEELKHCFPYKLLI